MKRQYTDISQNTWILFTLYTHTQKDLPKRDVFYLERDCLLQASKIGAAFLKNKNPNQKKKNTPSNQKNHIHTEAQDSTKFR